MTKTRSGRREPGLADKVAFLKQSSAYPSAPGRVEAVETHMAWVFLSDLHAWKLKKPVKTPFLDFSTIEKRRLDCQEEIRLNRRLAPDVYLGVVPLVIDEAGSLKLNGTGSIVDWLVQMRRLEKGRDLESMIQSGTVSEGAVRRVAAMLGNFYLEAVPVSISAHAYVAQFADSLDEQRRDLLSLPRVVPADQIDHVMAAQKRFLDRRATLLAARAQDSRIVEAHGDLRPEHIWLSDLPVIIDRLEFNRELRMLDPFSELAFLALECERLQAAWIGDLILAICSKMLNDVPASPLLGFYRRWHACTRARIALWHLRDQTVNHPDKWRERVAWYLRTAVSQRLNGDPAGANH